VVRCRFGTKSGRNSISIVGQMVRLGACSDVDHLGRGGIGDRVLGSGSCTSVAAMSGGPDARVRLRRDSVASTSIPC
jgi:hypothetical protein